MRINTLIRSIKGELIKKCIDLCFFLKIKPGRLSEDNDIIVSLTSYGRRVKSCVPYVVYYLFKQSQKPSRIILWLDSDNWNEHNLPSRIKFLIQQGVEVRFCKDIRSYKKLVFTLQNFPDNPIVTIDDDLLYYKNLISELLEVSKKNPESIVAMRHHQPVWEIKNEKFLPYRKWITIKDAKKDVPCMPTTGGGTFFPPHCFNEEAINEQAFMKLCPTADDVWFWAMALYSKTNIVGLGKDMYYPIDAFYQNLHKGAALEHFNVDNDTNDKQIKAVFDNYQLWDKI